MLDLVAQGAIAPPAAVDDAVELAEEYAEAIGWASDLDSGLRLGFPGKNLWTASELEPERSGQRVYFSRPDQRSVFDL